MPVIDDAMMAISIDDIMDVDFGEPEEAEKIAAIEDEIFGDVAEPVAEQAELIEAPAEEALEEPAVEPVEEMPLEEPEIASVEESVPAADEEPEPAPADEDLPESFPEEDDEPSFMDIFGMAQSDEGTLNARHRATKKKAVMDVMATKEAWRSDMPGSPVKDIRSAISLNDRILFIRTLFDEDPVIFQDTIAEVNGIATLDEAVDYLKEHNPAWDFDSDVVYRFMMAVRRKIR